MNDHMLDAELRSLARFTDDEVRALDLGRAEADLLASILVQPRAASTTPVAEAPLPTTSAARDIDDDSAVPVELVPMTARGASRRRFGWATAVVGTAAALVAAIAIGSGSNSSRVIVRDPGSTSDPAAVTTTFVATAATRTSTTSTVGTITAPVSVGTTTAAPEPPATEPAAAPVTEGQSPTTVSAPVEQDTTVPTEPPSTLATGTNFPLPLQPWAGPFNFVSVPAAGRLLVWSPVDRAGVAIDPTANTIKAVAALPFDVASATSSGSASVAGGALVWADGASAFYDPAQNTWSAPQPMPETRIGGLTTAAGDRVLVWSGSPTPAGFGTPAVDLLVWSATSRTWSRSAPAPAGGRGGLLSSAAIGDVVYFDGETGQDSVPILAYHLSTDSWTQLTPPVALPYAPYIVGRGGRLLAIALDHSASAILDPATGGWSTATPTMAADHGRHVALGAAVGSNFVYLGGDGMLHGHGPSGWGIVARAPINASDLFVVGDHLVVPGVSSSSVATWFAMAWVVPLGEFVFR